MAYHNENCSSKTHKNQNISLDYI